MTISMADGITAINPEVDPITNATITGGTINGTSVGATTPSTGSFTTLNTTGIVSIQSQISPAYPVPSYPEGNDLRLVARGPADTYVEHLKAATTTSTTLSVGANASVVIGAVTVSNTIRGTEQTGTSALLSTVAGIIIGRSTANEETVNAGSWSIVDGTHLSITCAKTHSGTIDIEQLGTTFIVSPNIVIRSDALNPAQQVTYNVPLTFFDKNSQTILSVPSDLTTTAPYSGLSINAIIFGANGANNDLVFRNNNSASQLKLTNAANTLLITTIDDSGNAIFKGSVTTATINAPATLVDFKTSNTTRLELGNTYFTGIGAGAMLLGLAGNGWKQLYIDYTNTATVGAVTINKAAGRVNLAAAGTSLTVTNSLVTANSHIFLNADSAPGNVVAVQFFAVAAAGSFTVNAVPAVTNQTAIDFFVVNAD